MIEFALGILFSPIFWGFLFALIWWMERSEVYFFFTFLFFGGLAYLIFHSYQHVIPLQNLKLFLFAYIPIGILWSFFRWGAYSRKKVVEVNKEIQRLKRSMDLPGLGEESIKKCLYEIDKYRESISKDLVVAKGENVERIIGWIVNWPISILNNVFNDLIEALERIIKIYFRGIYNRITQDSLKNLE